MSIDLTKLRPAPWIQEDFSEHGGINHDVSWGDPKDARERWSVLETLNKDEAVFIALARNAFDVMMRRGWHPVRSNDSSWFVSDDCSAAPNSLGQLALRGYGSPGYAADPFTALVEADRWYREHVEVMT